MARLTLVSVGIVAIFLQSASIITEAAAKNHQPEQHHHSQLTNSQLLRRIGMCENIEHCIIANGDV